MYRYKNLFNLNLIPLILHSKWNLIQVFYLILHLEKLSHSLVFNNSQNKKKKLLKFTTQNPTQFPLFEVVRFL